MSLVFCDVIFVSAFFVDFRSLFNFWYFVVRVLIFFFVVFVCLCINFSVFLKFVFSVVLIVLMFDCLYCGEDDDGDIFFSRVESFGDAFIIF